MKHILFCSVATALATLLSQPVYAAPKGDKDGDGRGRSGVVAQRVAPAAQRQALAARAQMSREMAAARESRPLVSPRANPSARIVEQRSAPALNRSTAATPRVSSRQVAPTFNNSRMQADQSRTVDTRHFDRSNRGWD